MIPTNGSTMTVVVDGVAHGTVSYNNCAGATKPAGPGGCRDDIATLFPNMTNIRNGIGAIGVFNLDTTKLANGLHTIAWAVTDNQGRGDGIGSRFFTVQNGSGLVATEGATSNAVSATDGTQAQAFVRSMSTASTADAAPAQVVGSAMDIAWLAPSTSEVSGQAGFNFDAPMEVDRRRCRPACESARRGAWPHRTAARRRDVRRLSERERHAAAAAAGKPAQYGDRPVHVGAGTGLRRHV